MHTGWMFCFFLKFTMWAKCVFPAVSHTFKFVKWNLKKLKSLPLKGLISVKDSPYRQTNFQTIYISFRKVACPMMATELLIFKQTISSSSGSPPPHCSYLLTSVVAGVNFYIFLLSLSAHINKPKAFTNTYRPAFRSVIKSFFFFFPPTLLREEKAGCQLFEPAIRKSGGNYAERSSRTAKGDYKFKWMLFASMEGFEDLLMSRQPELNICGTAIFEREAERGKRGRGEERREERKRGFDPGRYLQGSAEQLSITDQRLSSERERELVEALFGSRG